MKRHRSISSLSSLLSSSLSLSLLLGGALAAGCGNTDPQMQGTGGMGGMAGTGGGTGGGAGGTGGTDTRPFLNLAVGNSWTYLVTDELGQVTPKTQTVEAEEMVGGIGPHATTMAFRLRTTKGVGGTDETISWQARVGTRIVRYREQSFNATTGSLVLEEYWDPPKLRVDESAENSATGATWLEIVNETKLPVGGATSTAEVRDRWTVTAGSQTVTVQGQTYDAMICTKVGSSVSKTYWFVRGLGKIKEIGVQTEELTGYQSP